MARPKVAVILTDDERVQLDSLAHRSRTAPHLARRARIVWACAEGIDNRVVARRLRMSEVTVCKWRGRFVRERLDGLYDEPRPGAPRRGSAGGRVRGTGGCRRLKIRRKGSAAGPPQG